jgi:D-3-phosphoglycerate dehydrogenase / 2-oxoglutarate reductase
MRVVVTDYNFEDLGIEREALEPIGAEVVGADAETEEEVLEAAEGADALLNQYAPVGSAVFDAVPDLRAVGRYGVGVDTVDLDAATDHGVWVLNVPSYCEDEVSTHALSLLLACERRVARFDRAIDGGEWDWKGGRPIFRQRGRTLGLAGFGKIPQRLAEKAAALGMDVVAYDPYVESDELAEHGVEKVEFDALLERSDAISVHTPLTDETRNLFDREAFSAMDEESVIVNTARGAVIDTEALAAALEEGEIRSAGLDVLPEEPPEESPLVGRDDVVLTPHVGWYSEESLVELRRTVAEDVARVLEDEEPENPVNEL